MKKFVILLVLFLSGCSANITSPLTITEIRHREGNKCWLRLKTYDDINPAWVIAKDEGCNYKVGDVLK